MPTYQANRTTLAFWVVAIAFFVTARIGHLKPRRLQKARLLLMRRNESLDLLSQSGIARAGLLKEGSPLVRPALHGCLKQLLDSLPTFRRHNYGDKGCVAGSQVAVEG